VLESVLPELCGLFTYSVFGAMHVELVLEEAGATTMGWSTWIEIQSVLVELVWNAAKHGCSQDHPDVTASVRVAWIADNLHFYVENDRAANPSSGRVGGLHAAQSKIVSLGGTWVPLTSTGGVTRVGFVMPRLRVTASAQGNVNG
jgi:hypothetical protein